MSVAIRAANCGFASEAHSHQVEQAEDVVADEIAVAVDDAAIGDASFEQPVPAGEKVLGKTFDVACQPRSIGMGWFWGTESATPTVTVRMPSAYLAVMSSDLAPGGSGRTRRNDP